jgi:hypothetical protein
VLDDLAAEHLAQVVIGGLAAGEAVEIDGLGVFYPDRARGFRFEPRTLAQVFIAYACEDRRPAEKLCAELAAADFSPWMDAARLLPGQNWPRAIEAAIESSGFFVACFSENSVNKRGGFQVEIRYALDCARRVPLDDIFVIPVRLDDCRLPRSIQRELHYVDLFPDWSRGGARGAVPLDRGRRPRRPCLAYRARTCPPSCRFAGKARKRSLALPDDLRIYGNPVKGRQPRIKRPASHAPRLPGKECTTRQEPCCRCLSRLPRRRSQTRNNRASARCNTG